MFRIIQPIKSNMHITVKHLAPAWWYLRGLHRGIDIRTRTKENPNGIGTPIYAVADGIWEKASYDNLMGNTIILRHGRYQSVYGHLSKMNYKSGYKTVKSGDLIGYSGNTGKICFGAHLHFEIRNEDKKIEELDPLKYIEAGKQLVRWARARAIMKVGDKGQINFLVKGGIVELNKDNCWDIISKNCWGISEDDYKDLLNLL